MHDAVPNLERIELLCQALASGRYPQGTGALRIDGRYCCIGVACDVADPSGWRRIHDGDTGHTWKFDTKVGYMPKRVAEWYGFVESSSGGTHGDNPRLKLTDGNETSMTAINDSYGYDFVEIARALRRTYLPHTIKTEEEDVVKT